MRGALLVDWENLVYDLYEQNYYYPVEELAKRLMGQSVHFLRQRYDVNLAYRGVFAPARAFNATEPTALVNAGFEVVNTLGGKNAADLALAIKAVRLFLEEPDYTHFIVVTGDVDYLALAREIERSNRICHLWPVSPQRVSRSVRDHDFVEYIPSLLGLEQKDPPGPDEEQRFVLLCHRLIDEGTHLGGIDRAKEGLMRLGGLGEGEVSRAFVQHQRCLAQSRVRLAGGRTVERRRPAYERSEVQRIYEAADLILDLAARRERRNGAREGELLECAAGYFPQRQDQVRFVETMVVAGYLDVVGDRYRLASALAGYGIVRPLYRIVLILWTLLTERGWKVTPKRFVQQKWERFYKPGGNLTQTEQIKAHDEALLIFERAEHVCVVEPLQDGEHRGYHVIESHPVAKATTSAVTTVIKTIAAAGEIGRRIPQDVVIEELTERFSSESTARFWLAALAASGHVPWVEKTFQIRRTKLVQSILDN